MLKRWNISNQEDTRFMYLYALNDMVLNIKQNLLDRRDFHKTHKYFG
jgi:hypothetical protein